MASFNRVILMGNLTRDVELRYTPGGTAVTEVGMAVNDRRKTQSGEWVEEVTFVDVTLWGRTAEVASEYLSKGSPILVEGRLKLDTWETDGQKRSKLRVVADRMQMVGSRSGGSGGGPGGSHGGSYGANQGAHGDNEFSQSTSQPQHSQQQPAQSEAPASAGASPPEADIPF